MADAEQAGAVGIDIAAGAPGPDTTRMMAARVAFFVDLTERQPDEPTDSPSLVI